MTNKEAADILENRMRTMETLEAIQIAIEYLRKEGE